MTTALAETIYFAVIAAGVSFIFLLVAGRAKGAERAREGLLYLLAINLTAGLAYLLARGEGALAVTLASLFLVLEWAAGRALPDWNTRGHAFLLSFGVALGLFTAQILEAILLHSLSPLAIFLSLILLVLEVGAVFLGLYYAYEVVNVMCRLRWRRHFPPAPAGTAYYPKVSIHVPAHREPVEMVLQTLGALSRLDYPDYEVIMVDDNTREDELWRPVMDYCHRMGFKVFHLQNYPGFKSGALNFALQQTAEEAEIIAVVDSDYMVEPNFLKETVPYFQRPQVAFVQTPQAFYNADDNPFRRRSALAQRFFFEIGMRSRNEENAIIFCGTMGLIRKRALQRIGGWDGHYLTEDAETSLRLLQRGYESVYIHRVYGRGLIPESFEATKKQRFRWAFGGAQILLRYWRDLLPWPRRHRPWGLTLAQRLHYAMGLMGWFNDVLILAFTIFVILTALAFSFQTSLPIRQVALWILVVPIVSIVTAVLRVAWALRATTGCGWRDGMGAFGMMIALSWTVAQACLAALWDSRGTFVRTPKFPAHNKPTKALQVALGETVVGMGLVALIPALLAIQSSPETMLLAALIGWHAAVYLAALRSALTDGTTDVTA
ncbi:MAG: glycosyltransferase [Chloroflexi bacterium]|nr:glycosyltransferase [Chloroflexota bacterium]